MEIIDPDLRLLLLADGMGGYNNGDLAADITINSVKSFFESSSLAIKERIFESCRVANEAIKLKVPGSGATLAGLCVDSNTVNIFWVGDVRVYIKELQSDFKFVTKDHTLAQAMKTSRILIKPSEFDRLRSTVTKGLGSDGAVAEPEITSIDQRGEIVGMICSDGFHNLFTDDEIFSMLNQFESESFVKSLIERVSANSKDNASVIAFRRTATNTIP